MIYVMQTAVGQEDYMKGQIEKYVLLEGESIYIPVVERKMKFHGEFRMVKRKFYPGYIFVESGDGEDLNARLKSARINKLVEQCIRILTTGSEITPLTEQEEEFLKKIGGKDHVITMSVGYMEGDRVIVTEGSLEGFEGLIRKINRHKRQAVIEVTMFNNPMTITVGLEIVNKA